MKPDSPTLLEGPLVRGGSQIRRVFTIMRDGQWHTVLDVAERTGDPPMSVSAQIRHLRKDRFGGFLVEREYLADGVSRYRVRAPDPDYPPRQRSEAVFLRDLLAEVPSLRTSPKGWADLEAILLSRLAPRRSR